MSRGLAFIADPRDQARLQQRVAALRHQTLTTLTARARSAGVPKPALRARIAFGLIAELTCQTFYEASYESEHPALAEQLLRLAISELGQRAPANKR